MTEKRRWDVLTFGETMLRLSPVGYGRIEEAISLEARVAGTESNTAIALARLGLRVAWWSRLPANPLGRRIEGEIRRWGVDTTGTIWDTSPTARAGLYFVEFGVAPRSTELFYDRAHSAFSLLTPDELDAEPIAQARLLHLTGITAALSPNCAASVVEAIRMAKAAATFVSFDVNYRAKLWTPAQARKTLEPLLSEIDLLLCPLEDAQRLFGIGGDGAAAAREMRGRYGVGAVVITSGAEGAMACDESGDCAARPLPLPVVVDRIGAGDAFDAGALMGWLEGDLEKGLRYGMAMAALKHTMPGDILLSTRAEIEAAVTGQSGAIRR